MSAVPLLVFVLSRALAADVYALLPEGAPLLPGDPALVEVVVVEGGLPAVGARVQLLDGRAPVGSPVLDLRPGHFRFRVDGGLPRSVRVNDGAPVVLDLVLPPSPPPTLTAPAPQTGGPEEPVHLRFPISTGAVVDADQLVVALSEGRVLARRVTRDAVELDVEPAPDRTARVLHVGLLDLTSPGQLPVWGEARLRAHQTADLQVGPGSSVLARVGSRRYGPFRADEGGAAHVAFDVSPGETTVELTATDDLGNTRTVQTPLPTSTSPTLAVLPWPLPEDAGVAFWLRAWAADGQPWGGDAPACVGPEGSLALHAGVRGQWSGRQVHDGLASLDVNVDCALGLAAAHARLPLGVGRPTAIDLHVYPDSLASDFPLAQAQAVLVDARGEHRGASGLTLSAARGSLTTRTAEGTLRAEYDGRDAIAAGGDQLVAAWESPPGRGGAWSLALAASADDSGVVVVLARALDREGRPLPGQVVTFVVDAAPAAPAVTAVTDARGWARGALVAAAPGLTVVRARVGTIERARAIVRGVVEPLPDPAAPDLARVVELPIRAGRVRRIILDIAPRPITVGAGESATISVRLLDAAGNLVYGESVHLTAELGELGEVRPRPDGTLEATWTPPARTNARSSRITAAVGESSVATDVEMVPRPVRGSLGLDGGWITNFGTVSGPVAGVTGSLHIPGLPTIASARVSMDTYAVDQLVEDEGTGRTIGVHAQFIPISLGAELIRREGRRSATGGIGLVLVPYSVAVDYGSERGITGAALGPPGVVLHAGAGWRLDGSELYAEARYLFAPTAPGALSFGGATGGLSLSAGYRVLY